MTTFKISVPKPCHENWDAMTLEDKGRFCTMCAKTVIDFTGMKQPDITDYVLANKEAGVCGRFTTNQLQQEAPPIISDALLNKIARRPLNFRQMFVVALMACMGSTLFSCNNVKGESAMDVDFKDTLAQGPPPRGTLGIVAYKENDTLPKVEITPVKAPEPKTKTKPSKEEVKFPPLTGAVIVTPAEPTAPTHINGDTIVTPE